MFVMKAPAVVSAVLHAALLVGAAWGVEVGAKSSVAIGSKAPTTHNPSAEVALGIELVVLREAKQNDASTSPPTQISGQEDRSKGIKHHHRVATRRSKRPDAETLQPSDEPDSESPTTSSTSPSSPFSPWRALARRSRPNTRAPKPRILEMREVPFPKRGSGEKTPFGWKRSGGGEFTHRRPGFTTHIARDGRVTFRDKSTRLSSPLSLQFDVTDSLMRSRGQDPYLAEKVAILDQSRDHRAKMGLRERKERLDASLEWLPKHLVKVWRMPGLSIAEKKRALFELWDECAEKGDPEVLSTAAGARRLIIRFIRRKLPSDSTHAFTEEELRHHNQNRRSKARFRPY